MKPGVLTALMVIAFSVASGLALLAATPFGPGVYSDSAMYFLTARSIAHGTGWAIDGNPVTVFPPLYPALLAVPALWSADLIQAARWIQISILMLTILLTGWLAYRFTGSRAATLIALIAIAGGVDILAFYSIALSDGLFLLFSVLVLHLLDNYLQSRRMGPLIASAMFASLAALTRYAGFAWIVAGTLAVLLASPEPGNRRKGKFLDAALFAVVSALPSVLWALRNAKYKSEFGRPVDFHAFLGASEFGSLRHTASAWLFQWGVAESEWIFAPLGVVAVVTAWITWKELRAGDPHVAQRLRLLLIFAAVYVLTLIFSAAIIQADLFRDSVRLLIPVHVILLMLLLVAMVSFLRRSASPGPGWRAAGAAAILLLGGVVATGSAAYIKIIRRDGQGYASSAYRFSPLMKRLSAIPAGITVYSNLDLPVTMYAGRLLMAIPEKIDNATQRLNPRYNEGMKSMASDLRDSSALLVVFRHTDNWLVYPSPEEIGRFVPIRVLDEEPDGAIYEAIPDSVEGE